MKGLARLWWLKAFRLVLLHPCSNQSQFMWYQGWDEILMITLISSKKLGVCNNMRNTVPNFRCHIKMTFLQKQFISFLWCVKILPKFLEIEILLPRFRCFVCWSPGAHWHTSMILVWYQIFSLSNVKQHFLYRLDSIYLRFQ